MRIIILLVAAVFVASCIAGSGPEECSVFMDGSKCGCFKNWCWAYLEEHYGAGDPWCYTQVEGTQGKQSLWAACSANSDCSWAMTCGNTVTHTGSDEYYPPPRP